MDLYLCNLFGLKKTSMTPAIPVSGKSSPSSFFPVTNLSPSAIQSLHTNDLTFWKSSKTPRPWARCLASLLETSFPHLSHMNQLALAQLDRLAIIATRVYSSSYVITSSNYFVPKRKAINNVFFLFFLTWNIVDIQYYISYRCTIYSDSQFFSQFLKSFFIYFLTILDISDFF